jgi:hypothetical protein
MDGWMDETGNDGVRENGFFYLAMCETRFKIRV